jgi:hypothetical protein
MYISIYMYILTMFAIAALFERSRGRRERKRE